MPPPSLCSPPSAVSAHIAKFHRLRSRALPAAYQSAPELQTPSCLRELSACVLQRTFQPPRECRRSQILRLPSGQVIQRCLHAEIAAAISPCRPNSTGEFVHSFPQLRPERPRALVLSLPMLAIILNRIL